MREFLTYCCVVLTIIKVKSCAASGNCSNKEQPCCTNYFLDDGICKVCLPGYFGVNCSVQCPFPNFGFHCNDICQCNSTECNYVNGCHRNNTANVITTASMNYTKVISTDMLAKAEESTTPTSFQNYITEEAHHLKIATICAGTILTILVVVAAMIKITNLIQRKCTIQKDYHDNKEQTTIYSEINGELDQMSSPIEELATTVLTRSCASLDDEDTRPELPVRNRAEKETLPINTARDDLALE